MEYLWDGNCCQSIRLGDSTAPPSPDEDDPVAHWLAGYFQNEVDSFPALAAPATPFQQRLRHALWQIPRGETRSYGELARNLNSAPRAVGQALHANTLPLLVPCHRVVSAHDLGGFAFGCTWKQCLLAFEQATR
ncbi:MAG: methylated-DNA--[protein]-cysteine S-methyltransferase [Mariprofundales bacterium]|nr:methylated-DNA--[protein]-cysteine S-methyltransferase [Mariprofundales bacterium]